MVELVQLGSQLVLSRSDGSMEWKVTLLRVPAAQQVESGERLGVEQEVGDFGLGLGDGEEEASLTILISLLEHVHDCLG